MFYLTKITKNLKFWNNWGQYNQFKVLLSNKEITKTEALVLDHLDTFKNFEKEHYTSRRDIAPFIACDPEATSIAVKGLIDKGFIRERKVNHHYYHFELLIINNAKSDEAKANASKYINTRNDAIGNPVHCAIGNPVHCAIGNPVHIVNSLEEDIEESTTLLFFGKDHEKNKKELLDKYNCDETKLIAVMEHYHSLWPKKKSLYRLFKKCIELGEFEKYFTRLREDKHALDIARESVEPIDIEGITQQALEMDGEDLLSDFDNLNISPEQKNELDQALKEMMLSLKSQVTTSEYST